MGCAFAKDTQREVPHMAAHYTEGTMSTEDATTLYEWQRTQSTAYHTAFVLGQFLGMVQMIEQHLITPEHFIAQCIAIAKEAQQ
jgi:hypothetical protein